MYKPEHSGMQMRNLSSLIKCIKLCLHSQNANSGD